MKSKKKEISTVTTVERLMNQKELILTIGIIGKNNEDTIERCLKSLTPLRKAVKSEIIYTDTGSTDNTVSIASEYVDKIINFEWSGDFAAARNTAVDEARGVWFMWIDTDEYFDESIEALINFFQSGEHKNYLSGIIKVKNIFSIISDYNFEKSSLHRLSVLENTDTKFIFKIHEGIPMKNPVKNIEAQLVHTGYVVDDKAKFKEKQKRNVDMLEEEIKDLNGVQKLRAIYHILKSYSVIKDYENLEKLSDEGIQEYRTDNELKSSIYANIYYNSFLIFKAEAFQQTGREKAAVEIINEIKVVNPKLEFMNCDKYGILYILADKLKNQDMKFENAIKFSECADLFNSGYLDKEHVAVYNLISNTPTNLFNVFNFLSNQYIEANDRMNSEKYLKSIENMDILSMDAFFAREYFKTVISFSEEFENLGIIREKYRLFLGENKVIDQIQIVLENHLMESDHKNDIINIIADLDIEDSYVKLNRMRKSENEDDIVSVRLFLEELLKDDNIPMEGVYYDVIYYAYVHYPSIVPEILRLYNCNIENNVKLANKNHPDFFETVKEYLSSNLDQNAGISQTYLNLRVVESLIDDSNAEKVLEIVRTTVPSYIEYVYSDEILNDENIIVIPAIMQFGYYLSKADDLRLKNDTVSCLKELKKAIKCYPAMKKAIEKILEEVKKEIEKQDSEKSEFAELAKQVKASIYELIKEDKYSEALGIVEHLRKLVPEDIELEEIWNALISKYGG